MRNISFLNDYQLWHLLVLSLIFICAATWEWRKKKPRNFLRITALAISLSALYIIYLRPVNYTEKPLRSVILAGEGLSQSYLDSLEASTSYELLFWEDESHLLRTKKGKESMDFADLEYTVDTLFTTGYISHINPASYNTRIILNDGGTKLLINYPQSISLGEAIEVELINRSSDSVKVEGILGGDSMALSIIPPGQVHKSEYQPKATGPVKGSFLVSNDETYQFSTLVREQKKYIFHLLAENPDFEWRFLQEYLTSEGHAVYLKSKISADKYKLSFSNWPDSLAQQKNQEKLMAADVIVSDMLAWKGLAKNAKSTYANVLKRRKGTFLFRSNPNTSISITALNASLKNRISTGNESFSLKGVNQLDLKQVKGFNKVEQQHLFKTILPDISVGVLLQQDTYKWMLKGEDQQYESYWSEVLKQLLRTQEDIALFSEQWAVQYQPFYAQLWSAEDIKSVKIVSSEQDTVSLQLLQDQLFEERKLLVFYPEKYGWHHLLIDSKTDVFTFYVHPQEMATQSLMKTAYLYDYQSYTQKFKRTELQGNSGIKQEALTFWFFCLFLLSTSYLWLEEKIS